jgi:hypothetical protein
MKAPDFALWYKRLKLLGTVAIFGVLACIAAGVHGLDGTFGRAAFLIGIFAVVPAFLYLYCLTILHWKHRYVGDHSTLWGVLLLIETSGWMKIVYFFRHIVPDMNGSGRYAKRLNQSVETTRGPQP